MHGGFDNESPTVPTDAIMKLDALSILRSNSTLIEKIKQFSNATGEGSRGLSPGGSTGSHSPGSASGSRSPMSGGITIEKAHVEPEIGADASMSPHAQPGSNNSLDSLCNLFLAHLLKPRDWASATQIGQPGELGDLERFYFR